MAFIPEVLSSGMASHGTPDGHRDLDVQQDDRFQQREWRIERVGTLLLALFILAGLLGVIGPGPVSHTTTNSEAGSFSVDYQRIAHYMGDDTLTVRVSETAVENGMVVIVLTGPWTSAVDISSVSPAPSSQYATAGGVAMEFEVLQPGDLEISFSFSASEHWLLEARATVGEDSVGFSQFVLP